MSRALLDLDPPDPRDPPVTTAAKRNRDLLEQASGVTVTNNFKHAAHSQIRSVLVKLEQRYPEDFDRVMRSRFRHPDDLSVASGLHHYYAYREGLAVRRHRLQLSDMAEPGRACGCSGCSSTGRPTRSA